MKSFENTTCGWKVDGRPIQTDSRVPIDLSRSLDADSTVHHRVSVFGGRDILRMGTRVRVGVTLALLSAVSHEQ